MNVTVLSGAGISTDSGIPDFRGPQGVWTKDPAAQALYTLQNYLADPSVRRRAWVGRREHPAWRAVPNEGHRALVELERAGLLRAIVTQNIDELHQRAGSSADRVVELHGTLFQVECVSCGLRTPMREVLERDEPDPACLSCGGIQKAATISFGQSLDPGVLREAISAARECDLLLAVGTSLTVQPAASLCSQALDAGAALVIMNAQPTPYDADADLVIDQPIGVALPAFVKELIDEAR